MTYAEFYRRSVDEPEAFWGEQARLIDWDTPPKRILDNDKSPSRKVKQLDNRGSTFYIALYWAEAMAKHDESFAPMAKQLVANEAKIVQELIDCQGPSVDIGGYWKPDVKKCIAAMRASPTFNAILDK